MRLGRPAALSSQLAAGQRLSRRKWLCLAGMAALAPNLARAQAQAYPARPLRLVVGFAPGGPNDILGRMVARWLSPRLGQAVVVDNLPGASGNHATEAVARAPADGHTLLLLGPANAINVSMQPLPGFDFQRDIRPVGGITREALVMLVHPSLPVNTVPEFVAYARARPGQVRMASTGSGSAPHLSGLQFIMMTGVELSITHYAGGGPALKEMIAGQAQMMFEPLSAAIEPVRSSSLRALGVTTVTRSAALPEVPVMHTTLPGFEASAVTGIGVPRATPPDIVARLNQELNAAFYDVEMKARLVDTGGVLLPGSSAEFEALVASEIERWALVVKFADAKPEAPK